LVGATSLSVPDEDELLRHWKRPEDHLNFIMTSDVFDHVGCPSRPTTVLFREAQKPSDVELTWGLGVVSK